mgnify:CR=1 FL=1
MAIPGTKRLVTVDMNMATQDMEAIQDMAQVALVTVAPAMMVVTPVMVEVHMKAMAVGTELNTSYAV